MPGWTFEEVQERFDDFFDAAEKHGPQIFQRGEQQFILATADDYQAHLEGKLFEFDEVI